MAWCNPELPRLKSAVNTLFTAQPASQQQLEKQCIGLQIVPAFLICLLGRLAAMCQLRLKWEGRWAGRGPGRNEGLRDGKLKLQTQVGGGRGQD